MQVKKQYKVQKTEQEWRQKLTQEEYNILRKEATETAFTSALNKNKENGDYICKACGQVLFKSDVKFDSGTGWPSFYDFVSGAVETKTDFKLIIPRTEVHCSSCGSHLGHVFSDGPKPTGKRYCINGLSLNFKKS